MSKFYSFPPEPPKIDFEEPFIGGWADLGLSEFIKMMSKTLDPNNLGRAEFQVMPEEQPNQKLLSE